ncbi:MAG: DMT family transporter [Paracoccaceae bacterium]
MPQTNVTIGLASAIGVIFVWSGFVVFSRAGVTTALTPYDVSALRFIVAGLATLPIAVMWWPRHLPWQVQALVAITGPGIIYSLLMFTGLSQASAAYGGVFANGSLPVFTALVVLLVTGVAPTVRQGLAIAVIFGGGAILGWRGMSAGSGDVLAGIAMFLAASAVLAVYIFALRHWQLAPKQALALVNLPNAVVFVPVWYVALPSGLAETPWQTVVFHALFQGLGPGFLAVILFALSARHLGATLTAGFSAVVPATATLLAIPVLGEVPTTPEWVGIGVVSAGLVMLVRG